MTPWLTALIIARALDACISAYALQQPTLVEAVKWMPSSPTGHVLVQSGAAIGQIWVLHKVSKKHPRLAKGLAIMQVSVSGTVVGLNIRVIRGVQR